MNAPTLHLDERQRAMLLEMGLTGVHLWLPPEVDVTPASPSTPAPLPPAATAQASPVATPVPSRTPVPPDEPPPWDDGPPWSPDDGQWEPVGPGEDLPARPPATPVRPLPVRPAAPARPPVPSPAPASRPAGIEHMDWAALQAAVSGCAACGLCQGRRQAVFGVGDTQADWLVVGEAPGEQEDLRGEPFVGPSGQLLDQMLKAIQLSRRPSDAPSPGQPPLGGVYIANVIKCRPPGNRNPLPAEVAQCEPYLARQVALLRPKIILALGRFAVQSLLGSTEPIGKLRGRVHQYQGVPVIVSYHPAYLLRNLPDKAKAWADLCLALEVAQRPASA